MLDTNQSSWIPLAVPLTKLLPLAAFAAGDFLAPFFGVAFTDPFLVTSFLAAVLLAGVFAFAAGLAVPFAFVFAAVFTKAGAVGTETFAGISYNLIPVVQLSSGGDKKDH